ncbi:riboflavin kinase [Arthrobacter sp. I2-34]|uniref:riboflavin kinase n=1 Tax=Arthrobacter hankyongi TaxID=2904801 RepID=A0ABS9LBD5_9MICC|nr:riboflavin kinase [Arthrobacter hankyongi]MCG2623916.1 riboflavin kinase [Arthrobacter hankyongi]
MKKNRTEWNSPPSRTPQSSRHQDHSYFQITGVVDHGDERGRLLGFPTANIAIPHSGVHNGVWAGTVNLGPRNRRSLHVAAVSIGERPTYYARGQSLLEANLLDFSGDLYGQTVVVTLRTLIRPQRKFAGTAELVDQIQDDVARVRHWAVQAGLGGCLREEQGANYSLSSPPGAGRL